MKYFYVEDDTGVLFAGNGTALALTLTSVAQLTPILKGPIPTHPSWLYFTGLVFAFIAKLIIQAMNSDIIKREKLNNAREVIMTGRIQENIPNAVSIQIEQNWLEIERQHGQLINAKTASILDNSRIFFSMMSAILFLFATSNIIYVLSIISP